MFRESQYVLRLCFDYIIILCSSSYDLKKCLVFFKLSVVTVLNLSLSFVCSFFSFRSSLFGKRHLVHIAVLEVTQ